MPLRSVLVGGAVCTQEFDDTYAFFFNGEAQGCIAFFALELAVGPCAKQRFHITSHCKRL